jgi:hypothetical protein
MTSTHQLFRSPGSITGAGEVGNMGVGWLEEVSLILKQIDFPRYSTLDDAIYLGRLQTLGVHGSGPKSSINDKPLFMSHCRRRGSHPPLHLVHSMAL